MEGFVGSITLGEPQPKASGFVRCCAETFAVPGLEGELVDSWADDCFALTWRGNSEVADLHTAWVDGMFVCLIGQVAVGQRTIPRPQDLVSTQLSSLVLGTLLLPDRSALNLASLCQLSGSFLILIYDASQECVYIIGDRFASRPLFYHWDQAHFLFSTDIRAVLSDIRTPHHLNLASVVEFLQCGTILEDRTLYKDIHAMPPAAAITVSEQGVRVGEYWELAYDEETHESEQFYVEQLTHCLLQATERLIPDLDNIGLMLSGGLDSRMIAACLKTLGKQATTLTFADFENGEVRIARRVAKAVGFKHKFVKRQPKYYDEIMTSAVQLGNGMYSCYHAHMLGLGPQVRDYGIRTLANGWGLDLLFGGSYFPKQKFQVLGRTLLSLKLVPIEACLDAVEVLLEELQVPMGVETASLLLPHLATLWNEWPRQVLMQQTQLARGRASDPYNCLDFVLLRRFCKFRSYLYPISVRPYARERCLLFDKDLLELYLSMPPRYRFNNRVYRKALHALNPRLATIPYLKTGVPLTFPKFLEGLFYMLMPFIRGRGMQVERLLGRYKEYPATAFDSYPDSDLLVRYIIGNSIKDILLNGRYLELELLDPKEVAHIWDLHMQERHAQYGKLLINLASFALWIEQEEGMY